MPFTSGVSMNDSGTIDGVGVPGLYGPSSAVVPASGLATGPNVCGTIGG